MATLMSNRFNIYLPKDLVAAQIKDWKTGTEVSIKDSFRVLNNAGWLKMDTSGVISHVNKISLSTDYANPVKHLR